MLPYPVYNVTLYITPHQVPDIPLLCPATLTLMIFLLPIHVFVLQLKQRIVSPTSLVLYKTIDSNVALAYLPTATVTSAVVDMIKSLVTVTKTRN